MQFDTAKLVPDVASRERSWVALDAAIKATTAHDEAPAGSPEEAAAKVAMDAADLAYSEDESLPELMTDENGDPVRCALSNVPIVVDDVVLTDADLYGDDITERVLRDLILPPKPKAATPEFEEDEAANG